MLYEVITAFLASDQCNPVGALDGADPVIHLSGEKPERKADRAAGMSAHPFDCQVGLARVGRSKHRLDGARSTVSPSERQALGHCSGNVALPLAARKAQPAACLSHNPQIV